MDILPVQQDDSWEQWKSYLDPSTTESETAQDLTSLATEENILDEIIVSSGGLPDGWPWIRPPSIVLRPLTPAISQAVSHLNTVQHKLALHCKRVYVERLSRQGSLAVSRKMSALSQEKQLRFSEKSVCSDIELEVVNGEDGIPSLTETEGAPVMVESLASEIVDLLAKLEQERSTLRENMVTEATRVENLGKRLDEVTQKRMYELPAAVQLEHESCAEDIAELKWHGNYRNRQAKRLERRIDVAERYNDHLQEGINHATKNKPLIEEKLYLENEAIQRIGDAHQGTMEELNETIEVKNKTAEMTTDSHAKANKERGYIKKELDSVREQLRNALDSLQEAKDTHDSYCTSYEESLLKIKDNGIENEALTESLQSCKDLLKMQNEMVDGLRAAIEQEEFEYNRLSNENAENEIESAQRYKKATLENNELSDGLKKKTKKLKDYRQKNRNARTDIEDMEYKLKECFKQKEVDEKTLSRVLKDMETTDHLLALQRQEYHKVEIVHTSTRDKLVREEEKFRNKEDAMSSTAKHLEKSIKDEIHKCGAIRARIATETNDYARLEIECASKQAAMDKKLATLTNALNKISDQVKAMRQKHEDRCRAKTDLNNGIEKVDNLFRTASAKLNGKINSLTPQNESFKKENLALIRQLEYMDFNTGQMKGKIKEMEDSLVMIRKTIKNNRESIEKLELLKSETDYSVEELKRLIKSLEDKLNMVIDRSKQSQNTNDAYIEERNSLLLEMEDELQKRCLINEGLSSRYKELQNVVFINKSSLICISEKLNHIRDRFTDYVKLSETQKHMRHCLDKYFTYRGLFNSAEFQFLMHSSWENEQEIMSVKDKMATAIHEVNSYLVVEADGSLEKREKSIAKEQTEAELITITDKLPDFITEVDNTSRVLKYPIRASPVQVI